MLLARSLVKNAHHEPVPILDQHVPDVAELCLLPVRLLVEQRVRVGDRGVRRVGALLAVEVDRGIARIVGRFASSTLLTGPLLLRSGTSPP
jgi:hypothetical protein